MAAKKTTKKTTKAELEELLAAGVNPESVITREEAKALGIDVDEAEANAVSIEEAIKESEVTYPRVIKSWIMNGFAMERRETAPGIWEDVKVSNQIIK